MPFDFSKADVEEIFYKVTDINNTNDYFLQELEEWKKLSSDEKGKKVPHFARGLSFALVLLPQGVTINYEKSTRVFREVEPKTLIDGLSAGSNRADKSFTFRFSKNNQITRPAPEIIVSDELCVKKYLKSTNYETVEEKREYKPEEDGDDLLDLNNNAVMMLGDFSAEENTITIYKKAIEKVAEEKKNSPEEEKNLLKVIAEAVMVQQAFRLFHYYSVVMFLRDPLEYWEQPYEKWQRYKESLALYAGYKKLEQLGYKSFVTDMLNKSADTADSPYAAVKKFLDGNSTFLDAWICSLHMYVADGAIYSSFSLK